MVKRSPQEEEEVQDFCRIARCSHTLDGYPYPKLLFVFEKYCNAYGSLLTKNEEKQNAIGEAYLTRFFGRPMRDDFEPINQADYDEFHTAAQIWQEKRQMQLSDFFMLGIDVPA